MFSYRPSLWSWRRHRASLHRGLKNQRRKQDQHANLGGPGMIDKPEIDEKADELGVHAANVQRDYVFGWLLSGISQAQNPLQQLLVLKGGNCFRKAYFEHARFSNDLDFSTQTELDVELLLRGLKQACAVARDKSGVEFLIDESRV